MSKRHWAKTKVPYRCEVCGTKATAHQYKDVPGKLIVEAHNDSTGFYCSGSRSIVTSPVTESKA